MEEMVVHMVQVLVLWEAVVVQFVVVEAGLHLLQVLAVMVLQQVFQEHQQFILAVAEVEQLLMGPLLLLLEDQVEVVTVVIHRVIQETEMDIQEPLILAAAVARQVRKPQTADLAARAP